MSINPADGQGGGGEPIEVVLTAIRLAARGVNLYTFERPDGGVLPAAEPGAHIGLHLPNGINRQYSLLIADPAPTGYTIGVKKELASRGASQYLHDEIRVGATLKVDPPRNNFPLQEDAGKSLLFAGGIGITPIYSMMRRLQDLGRDYDLYYVNRYRQGAAFHKEFQDQPNVHVHIGSEQGARLSIASIVAAAPAGTHFYCCGPASMLADFEAACAAAGVPPANVHLEYFTARQDGATEGGFVVELARSGTAIDVTPGKTILQAVTDAGILVAHSCDMGICGTCETRVLAGEPDHRDSILNEEERAANKSMMICCSGSRSPRLVLDL